MLKRNDHAPRSLALEAHGRESAPPRKRHWRRTAAFAAAMGGFSLFVGSGLLKCPTAKLFHVPCPACGSSRTMHALLHGDLAGALRYNPLAPIIVLLVLAIAARALVLTSRDGHARRIDEESLGRVLLLSLVALVTLQIVHWALRFFGWFGGPCPV